VTPDRRTLLALFSLAFGLRILFAALFGTNPEVITVQETYDFRIAQRMAADPGWITTPFSPNAPGYMVALAAAFKVAGASWWTAVVLNALFGAATTLFLYRIGERKLGRGVGLVAALWLGLSASHIIAASVAARDVLAVFIFVWLVYTFARPFHRMRTSVWQAFLFTLLVRTEPRFIWFLPVMLVFQFLWSTCHREMSMQYLVLFVTALVVLNIPGAIRNYVVYRDFFPLSIEARRYTAPLAGLLRPSPPAPPVTGGEMVVHAPGFMDNTVEFWRVARFAEAPAQPEHALKAQPAWSLRHNLVSIVSYGILLPFALAGLVIGWGRRHRTVLVLSGAVVVVWLIAAHFGGAERARLPAEPLLILLGLYGARELLELRRIAGQPRES
jgi:4-amino-4-deoxy-L-arabinose transferase-like glycosyltransferase